tara:strand:+ start:1493 stop:1843 length:351 start_codon:yes stop_codon:yes gene_type:complete
MAGKLTDEELLLRRNRKANREKSKAYHERQREQGKTARTYYATKEVHKKLKAIVDKTKPLKKHDSGCKGVTFNEIKGKWEARLYFNHEYYYLGVFTDLDEAIKARKDGEKKILNNG